MTLKKEISLEERIEAMNMLMEILENPNAESTKEKIEILTGSNQMVQNPKYRI